MTLGQLIRERRTATGFASQAALVARLGLHGIEVTRQTVSNWERGASIPPRKTFVILLDVLAIHGTDRDRAYRLAAGEQA